MDKKARFIVLLICVALFLIIAPYLAMYSMGYRLNFETWEVTATGGIYVSATPQASEIIIDASNSKKLGIFSNSVFVQDLIPQTHTVLIKKEGYFDYQKTLDVIENEVAKLEKVILFKNTTRYDLNIENVESFSISPDKRNILAEGTNTQSLDFYYFTSGSPETRTTYSLPLKYTSVIDVIWSQDSKKTIIKTRSSAGAYTYYLLDFSSRMQTATPISYLTSKVSDVIFNPQDSSQIFWLENNSLYSAKDTKATSVAKNVINYAFQNGNIIWLSTAGQLYQSDISGQNPNLLANWPVNKEYMGPDGTKIEIVAGKIIISKEGYVYQYMPEEKGFKQLSLTAGIANPEFLASPNGKNMLYYDNLKIYLYAFEKSPYNKSDENDIKLFTAPGGQTISGVYWLNDDYVIFESGNRIIISEIDFRGNINQVELQNSWPAGTDSSNPKIIFNQQDNKVYVLTGKSLYSSEKLVP
jgi:hypothetical protein